MAIIEVNHVTKEYQLGQLQSLKTSVLNQWRRLTGQPIKERTPFKALDNVNFSAEQGEVLGIIDTNGAGTRPDRHFHHKVLLAALCRLLRSTNSITMIMFHLISMSDMGSKKRSLQSSR